jgi:hypothetical protein
MRNLTQLVVERSGPLLIFQTKCTHTHTEKRRRADPERHRANRVKSVCTRSAAAVWAPKARTHSYTYILFSHTALTPSQVYMHARRRAKKQTRQHAQGQGLHNGRRRPFIHMNDSFSAVAFHPPPAATYFPCGNLHTRAERKG